MNKEDILLLDKYFSDIEAPEELKKLADKIKLIKRQIEAQDTIQEINEILSKTLTPSIVFDKLVTVRTSFPISRFGLKSM